MIIHKEFKKPYMTEFKEYKSYGSNVLVRLCSFHRVSPMKYAAKFKPILYMNDVFHIDYIDDLCMDAEEVPLMSETCNCRRRKYTSRRKARIVPHMDNKLVTLAKNSVSSERTAVEVTLNHMIDDTKNMAFFKFKNHFGKEYYLDINIGSEYNKGEIEFLKSIDKKFDYHFDTINNRILPFQTFIMVDKATIIFMASSYYIPGKIQQAIMSNDSSYNLYIYIFGKKMLKYSKKLDEIMIKARSSSGNMIYTVNEITANASSYDIVGMPLEPRDMESLIYSYNELDAIKNHVEHFNSNREFYKSKNLLYKTGMLLYGKPGTGKSTLVKTIATRYGRSIISINLSNIDKIDLTTLTKMINDDKEDKYIVLFEDIDTLFLNRDDDKSTDKNYNDIINKLLQFLDSNSSPTDTIFIATTNHKDRLDDALIREGRFDLKLEVKGLLKDDVHNFLKAFDLDEGLVDTVIKDYDKSINRKSEEKKTDRVTLYNQSKLQYIMINYVK